MTLVTEHYSADEPSVAHLKFLLISGIVFVFCFFNVDV